MGSANRTGAAALRLGRGPQVGALAVALVALDGCGSSSTPLNGPDSGTVPDSSAEAADRATGCSTLPNTAPSVLVRCDPSTGPAPAGGAVSDGTYYLSDTAVLNGGSSGTCPSPPLANQTSKTIRIHRGTFEAAAPNSSGGSHYEASWSASGTTITFTIICETPQPVHVATFSNEYTATATQIVLFSRGSTSSMETYTKQ